MKRPFLFYSLIIMTSLFASFKANTQPMPAIVPMPNSYRAGQGGFVLNQQVRIATDDNPELKTIRKLLAKYITILTQSTPDLVLAGDAAQGNSNMIILTCQGVDIPQTAEGYALEVNPDNISIKAKGPKGVFYGVQTLLQMLPPEIMAFTHPETIKPIPSCQIVDSPRFAYRGMHLDVCRHIFPVEFIKKYIDLMALYKMNTLHWHLTDDQGWRIEIKKYPLLTQIGSMRKGTQIGKASRIDNQPYGGFYTQQQAREIVKYAAERYITVIPEIEMPGHAIAALTAYPSLSCTGGPFEVRTEWGVSDDIFCAGNDSVFSFLEDVLTEVMDIFPSPYIHVGGDEAPHGRWKNCKLCQQRIADEGLKNEGELQSYFVKRIEKFLLSKGRHIIGWDEILEGGLAPEATVMSWRGMEGGIVAARQHHDVIMTPGEYCYLDHYQADPATEPLCIGGMTTLKKCYSFEPVPMELDPEEAKYILGPQGNVWTEYIPTAENAEYKAFPRAIALAEVGWTNPQNKDWENFYQRMQTQFKRLDALHVNYSKGSYGVTISSFVDEKSGLCKFKLSTEAPVGIIRYTTDGSIPTASSGIYKTPIALLTTSTLKAALFLANGESGPVNSREVVVTRSFNKTIKYLTQYSSKYPALGDRTLTDGIKGGSTFRDGWQGFLGNDAKFIMDLGQRIALSKVSLGSIIDTHSWVLFPEKVSFEFSNDNANWFGRQEVVLENSPEMNRETREISITLPKTEARYIRVSATNPGKLPEWHYAKGEDSWIFFDEITVE